MSSKPTYRELKHEFVYILGSASVTTVRIPLTRAEALSNMKPTHLKLILVLSLLIAFTGLLPSQERPDAGQSPDKVVVKDKRLDIEYDKVRDRTNIQLKDEYALDIKPGRLASLKLNIYYHCSGQDSGCRPYTVLLSFVAYGSGRVFEKSNRELILLLDNQRLPLGQLDWDGSTSESSPNVNTIEQMTVYVPTSTFERMLRAKAIEGQIGSTTFKVDPRGWVATRELFKFPPEPPTQKQQGAMKPH